jgi:hypothetical protein
VLTPRSPHGHAMRAKSTGVSENEMNRAGYRARLLAGAVATAFAALLLGAQPSVAASVPYVDPNAVGSIGLCDQTGQPLTHGSIDDKPFIWKAVDETAAKAPYNVTGASATLYAYQPREGVDPREWSGSQLSAASKFSDPTHPTAAMTGLDGALSRFLTGYPAQWDGLVQLRIYLGAPGEPIYSLTYDSADIKVNGQTWSVVKASSVSCGSGSAVSLEQILATNPAAAASLSAKSIESAQPTPKTAGASGKTASNSTASAGQQGAVVSQAAVSGGGSAPADSASTSSGTGAASASGGGSGGISTPLLVLIGIGVVGAGFVGWEWVRSRS